jgi:hypothetical protein
MSQMVKIHKFKQDTYINGFREMTVADIPIVCDLLNAHLNEFKVHINFSPEEVKHFLLPQKGVVFSYVVEDESSA